MLLSVFHSDPQRYLVSHEQDSKLGVIELELFSLNINTCEKFASWETEPEEFGLAPPLKAAFHRYKAGCTQSEGREKPGPLFFCLSSRPATPSHRCPRKPESGS